MCLCIDSVVGLSKGISARHITRENYLCYDVGNNYFARDKLVVAILFFGKGTG